MIPQAMNEDPESDHIMMDNTKVLRGLSNKEEPEPLTIFFLEKVQHEWEGQQLHLDGLVDETIRNENSLFNPIIMQKPLNPFFQLVKPGWIQLLNDETMFTNERLTSLRLDISTSSVMGELIFGMENLETFKHSDLVLPIGGKPNAIP